MNYQYILHYKNYLFTLLKIRGITMVASRIPCLPFMYFVLHIRLRETKFCFVNFGNLLLNKVCPLYKKNVLVTDSFPL